MPRSGALRIDRESSMDVDIGRSMQHGRARQQAPMSGSRKSAYGLLAPVAEVGLAGAAFGLATPASATGAGDAGAAAILSIPATSLRHHWSEPETHSEARLWSRG